jgi:hypothetical protein
MQAANRVQPERRSCEREEVFYRTRASAVGFGSFPVQIVNISAQGCMARTEVELAVGQELIVRLPVVGEVRAEVRWSLGGRVGCQFARMIELAPYLELLGQLVKETR